MPCVIYFARRNITKLYDLKGLSSTSFILEILLDKIDSKCPYRVKTVIVLNVKAHLLQCARFINPLIYIMHKYLDDCSVPILQIFERSFSHVFILSVLF